MRDWLTPFPDEVIDPIGAVAGGVQHSADYAIRLKDPLLNQALQRLLDVRPESDKNCILELFDLGREVLHKVLS